MTRQRRRRGEEWVTTHSDAAESPVVVPSFDGMTHGCGGSFALVCGDQQIPIRGTTVTVEVEFYRCSGCGEERFDLVQLDRAREAAATQLTSVEGLLRPDEIRALRERSGLSQAAFEQALGFGPKTMVRWESGKVVPSRAAALLLVALRRDPSLMEHFQGFALTDRNST